ncbi:uncharacterized protein LOC142975862 [Anticarsia gemmatalis]|uniref:uncharacterized protein LOC142975862 n=1 Tax=Anticarsia gemmatalis TaxID=129554 RepID=UPI003F75E9AA
MSKANSLAGLIANYGDSEDESEDDHRATGGAPEPNNKNHYNVGNVSQNYANTAVVNSIHPAPIAHCPWSACYDESSGFTYYWNQQTNAVTWDAPPEYLLALKLAQQQLSAAGSGEVSAEEWQLYQQALAEKQTTQIRPVIKMIKPKKIERNSNGNKEKQKQGKKRGHSDEDEEKIELITSYHNSDSDSNDEQDTPVKASPPPPLPKAQPKPNNVVKKPKLKPIEYGPALPPNLNYSAPIGPELPPEISSNVVKSPEIKIPSSVKEEKTSKPADEDSQDETTLLMKLKDKARLLEKLGGELPRELQKMIDDETASGCATPKTDDSKSTCNIDDLLEEIEKRELPKIAKSKKESEGPKSNNNSAKNSPIRDGTPPIPEHKPLFPSIKNIEEPPPLPVEIEAEDKKAEIVEKKGANLYLSDTTERVDNVKKKLRISNSVLPKKEPVYTTKYSQFIEGFSNERVGLGFSKDEDSSESPKNAITYGNGLVFTKGETLNEEKKDEDLDDMTELLEMKLKYLNQLQPCSLTPVQEMLIQMQTLVAAFRAGALSARWWRRWAARAARLLAAHERGAAPPGWTCAFERSEGRYCYRRESDGLVQWEYPATAHTDMDISTTPPHPGIEAKEEVQPPLPPTPPPVTVPSPPRVAASSWRARTPPPPSWADPPPPGCDDLPPLPATANEPKQEIGDELASFYNDLAELEKVSSAPQTAANSPEPEVKERPERHRERERDRERDREREREREKEREVRKKKSKVKISSSIGLKQKSVSSLVAKWQQVADEINSD